MYCYRKLVEAISHCPINKSSHSLASLYLAAAVPAAHAAAVRSSSLLTNRSGVGGEFVPEEFGNPCMGAGWTCCLPHARQQSAHPPAQGKRNDHCSEANRSCSLRLI